MSGLWLPITTAARDEADIEMGLTNGTGPPPPPPAGIPASLSASVTSSSSSMSSSVPTAGPSALRFPSSFADFKLPTSPSSSLSPHSQDGPPASGGLLTAGMDSYPLFNRRLRRGSTLSLANHSSQEEAMDSPAQSLPSGPFSYAPSPPHLSNLIPPSRPQTPPNHNNVSSYRPSSSSSSAMAISPASAQARLRSASPPAVPTLNPPQFRETATLPKHPIHRLGMQRNHSFTGIRSAQKGKGREMVDSDSPSEPDDQSPVLSASTPALRPITRRGSLYPKHLAHVSTAKMLSEDPVSSEIRSEAQIQRLLQSQSSTPASSRLRQSSLSFAGRGRFPEDADDGDSDIYGSTRGGSSSSSSETDFGMEEEDAEIVPPAAPPNSVIPSLGQHFPKDRFPPLMTSSGVSPLGMALNAALVSSGRPSSASGLLTHRAAGLSRTSPSAGGDLVMGGMESPKSISGSPVGGWRDTGSGRVNKRKAAADERFEPYGSSFAFKRRAVSPSTVFPPTHSLGHAPPPMGSPTTAVRSPARVHPDAGPSLSSSTTAASAPIPISPAGNLSNGYPSSYFPPSSTHGPVSPYYTTSRSSRGGSPVPQPMSTSAGRMFGGSAPGLAGSGLGLSLLARDREGRKNELNGGGIGGVWESEGGLGGLKLSGSELNGAGTGVG